MGTLTICCPCLFGLESVLSGEIKRMGGQNIQTTDGKVTFEGDFSMVIRANIYLRTAERVLIVLGSFPARTFTELFDGTVKLPFEDFIGSMDAFPVKGWSLNSQLHSVPDCQRIIKKAAVDKMKQAYAVGWFPEEGVKYQIRFALMNDEAEIYLDLTGAPLYKRGYRLATQQAPLRETLAASLVKIARYRGQEELIDPFCGSGTIAIEGAMAACHIAPGARRSFEGEAWQFDPADWQGCKEEAMAQEKPGEMMISASDLSADAIVLAQQNAERAGVAGCIRFRRADALGLAYTGRRGVLLTNPPYGHRLLDVEQAREIYDGLGRALQDTPGLKKYIFTADEEFEAFFGHKADKRRKLYNGMLKCQLYMYYKQAMGQGRGRP